VVVCPSCATENPPGFRFCGSCGAALDPQPSETRETRKTVTVVFCDVTGSTALGERLDPESLRSVMARYFEAMRGVIEHHGGTVEKFIGDAVMAVFGVPTLHEDDALRAVRAASEMRASLAELNAELSDDYGTTLVLRTGVNTGEVVTGTEERLATGDAVNVAARLEQAAEPGEILLGPETLRLVRDAVDVEPVQPLLVKGKSSPLAAHRLVHVEPHAPGHARRFDAPLVGRGRELHLLADTWERAVSERSCFLFTLLGTAGVGKSRLVGEFLAGLDATILRGRCLSYGEGITYWPVVEALLPLLGAERQTATRELGLDEAVASTLGALLGETDAAFAPEQAAWAVRKLFEAQASRDQLVVVFDDIHWGEPTFLDLVEHVAGLSRGAPILLLCIARPELLDGRPGWAGGMLNATNVLLEPLSVQESEELVERLLGDASLDAELSGRILRTAGGNPLFLEEMLAMVRERGEGEIEVPLTIQALLAARLDQLATDERDVLERGAVEGEVFHRGTIVALASEDGAPDARLTKLVRKELIRPDRAVFPGDEAYRFRHLLIRDAAYDSLPKSVRATLHKRFARWLEEHAVGLVEADEIIGYHFEQAYRYSSELGPVGAAGERIALTASERLGRAGRTALARMDARTAAPLLRRAIELLPGGHPARAPLLCDVGETYHAIGDLAEATARLREAIEAARQVSDEHAAVRARLRLLALVVHADPTVSFEESVREADGLVEDAKVLRDASLLAEAWLLAGRLRFFLGRAAEAETAYAQAVEEAQNAGDLRIEHESLGWWAGAKRFGPATAKETIAFCAEAAGRMPENLPGLTWVGTIHAVALAMQKRGDEARRLVEDAKRLTSEYGLRLDEGTHAEGYGHVYLLLGEPETAVRELRSGYEVLEGLGETGFRSSVGCELAEALLDLGRSEEVAPLLDEIEAMTATDDLDPLARVRAARARLSAEGGRFDEAERLMSEALKLYDRTDYVDSRAGMLLAAAAVHRASGRLHEARDAAVRALDLFEQKGNLVQAERTHDLLSGLR
jgi:class 3 adenylate cyclase/tetratricopeptide (TPR) repeat protein